MRGRGTSCGRGGRGGGGGGERKPALAEDACEERWGGGGALEIVGEEEWRKECEYVCEDDAYTYVLRQHPYTNWHPLVEGKARLG